MPAAAERPSLRSSFFFFSMVLAFCAWVLSLPIFPSRDGPAHKYYVRVIAQLFAHNPGFSADYAFRHPLPPYISHYLILYGLNRLLPIDRAEECFVCIILFALAYGVRYCARSVGPGGSLVSFCVAPLLLNFVLFMGFFNYTLGIALSLFAAGIFLRATRLTHWIAYVLVILLLAITHPVPMLLLLVFLFLYLVTTAWNSLGASSLSGWLRQSKARLLALLVTSIAFLYPVLAADRSRSQKNLRTFHIHAQLFAHFAALSSVMPYDPRSRGFLINAFRLILYMVILGSIAIAARGLVKRFREHTLEGGDTFLISSLLLLVAVPIIPEEMNGSSYFASRMMIFAVLGCLISAARHPFVDVRLRQSVLTLAAVSAIFSLFMANHYFRPVSYQLSALEHEPLPPGTKGLVLSDPDGLFGSMESTLGLGAVVPYGWAGALPVTYSNSEILNPPWLDLTIMPLVAQPHGALETNLLTPQERVVIGGPNDGSMDFMARPERDALLAEAAYVVFTGSPEDLALGLPGIVHSDEALQFACRPAQVWYLICVRK